MICDKTITCFIPAKGTSTRMAHKNLRQCDGLSLVAHAAIKAESCGIFDTIVVSTDSIEITLEASNAIDSPVLIHDRPSYLCTETSKVWDAVKHWIHDGGKPVQTDYICMIHPTSPCLKPLTIVAGIRMMLESGRQSLISVTKASPYHFGSADRPDFSITTGTQFEAEYFSLNNAIHVIPWSCAAQGQSIYATDWTFYPIPADEGIDIDVESDLQMAEAILQWRMTNDR